MHEVELFAEECKEAEAEAAATAAKGSEAAAEAQVEEEAVEAAEKVEEVGEVGGVGEVREVGEVGEVGGGLGCVCIRRGVRGKGVKQGGLGRVGGGDLDSLQRYNTGAAACRASLRVV